MFNGYSIFKNFSGRKKETKTSETEFGKDKNKKEAYKKVEEDMEAMFAGKNTCFSDLFHMY